MPPTSSGRSAVQRTIGTNSLFQGNILASDSISMLTGSTLSGRALAIGGSVSIDSGTGGGATGGASVTIPVPATGPRLTSTVPANGAIGVPIGNKLSATFSTAMDPSTITTATLTLKQGTTPIAGVVNYAGTTATFGSASALAPNTVFTATIATGAKDQAGDALASSYVWSFTTGAAADTIPPTVVSTVPSSGFAGANLNGKLSVTFSKAMDPATISASTFTVAEGAPFFGGPVSGVVTYAGTTATFASGYIHSRTYIATITTGSKDLAGNALASNYVWSFFTDDSLEFTIPTVISTVPASGAQGVTTGSSVSAIFSEPMDPATITTATFTLQQGVTPVSGTLTYNGATANFTPLSSLTSGTVYTATITNGAKDLGGNAPAPPVVWNFTTAAATTAPPSINSGGIVNGASYASPIAPGSIVAVFGSNLAIAQASSVMPTPLPIVLAQTSFTVGGADAPLFFAMPNQVNLQIPWLFAGGTQVQIVAKVNGLASSVQTVPLVIFAPSIFSTDMTGTGQGAILIANTSQLAAPGSTPVQRGGYVSIFCTGLGPVTNQPDTGVAALANPLSPTSNLPTVTIGGVMATVNHSGLAPGYVGLY